MTLSYGQQPQRLCQATVNILEGRETTSHQTEQRFKQSGLSLSLSSPVIDSAQGLQRQANAASDTQSTRMHALAAANSALAVKDIQQQRHSGQGTDLSLNISLGSSQSRSQSTAASNTARGSTLTAGGDLAIHALGEGDGEGTITVQGSQLDAGNQLQLNAAQDIHLLASADSASQHSSHRSSSGSIGLGVGTKGLALNLDANRAQGHGNGDSTTYTNTQLSAGSQVILTSGGDTALKGAVVSAPQITTHIGGKLTIESLQDSATHNERHSSSGASLSVPLIGAGLPTASLDASRTKINSDTQSVNEQSGLRADDGGFQVNVGGTTHLNGGAITSTQVAIDEDRNTFTTAGQSASEALQSGALTLSDIGNNATFDAESLSVGLSSGGNNSGESNTGLSGIGTGRDDGSASSTTVAAISGLAGNQDARTGDAESGLAPIFDADNARKDVQAQATITQEFGSRASQEWGDYASHQEAQLWREAQNATDPETRAALLTEASRWAEGGAYRTSGHTLMGLAGGGVDGATGALTSAMLMPEVERLTDDMNLPDGVRQGLESLTATLAGAATGGTQGGAMAFNLDANNRQLHSFEQSLAEQLAEGSEYTPDQIADALRAMYNDDLGESPGSNIIVDLQDVAAVDDTYFDYGGDWITTPGEDGTTRYLIQPVSKNTPPELTSYIIEQTGGESSPYRAPVYQLPPEDAAPGQPRDRLTGRPLDEEGRYTVSYVVDGKIYHVPHFSCGDAECIRRNANIDHSDPAAQEWERAVDAKALDDLGTAATVGVVMNPAGAVGQGLAYAGMGTGLLSGYLKDETGNALSKEVLMVGFEEYAKARGYPAAEARRLTQALNLSGIWDEAIKNSRDMLGLDNE
ncbi:hemagglutinin repeat-containing protein [Vreelandella zhaodongensis]|uniref:hemagglutinin repeat-containing protein n=1 Tax=Vreelandella zhaodongensis TaxID=1176240 RepID=UPI003EBB3192